MHCRSLPNPREGELTIRLVTGAPTPSDLGVVDAAAHEKTVEFVFDPHYELQTLDRSFRFFSTTLKTFFGLDPQASREIGRQMGSVAHDWLRGRRCGLSMWAELKPAPAPAEVILGNLVFNGGDGSGECCHDYTSILQTAGVAKKSSTSGGGRKKVIGVFCSGDISLLFFGAGGQVVISGILNLSPFGVLHASTFSCSSSLLSRLVFAGETAAGTAAVSVLLAENGKPLKRSTPVCSSKSFPSSEGLALRIEPLRVKSLPTSEDLAFGTETLRASENSFATAL
nr:uncharacterized protein LOC109152215 [Ipomoea batatas]